jgi:hypothetical protein
VEYDGHLSLNLQHSFDHVKEPQFFDRGTVHVQSIRTGAVTLQQKPLSVEDKQKLKVSSVHFIITEQFSSSGLKQIVKVYSVHLKGVFSKTNCS